MFRLRHNGGVGCAPRAQNGVGHLGAAPEVQVHVFAGQRQRSLDPEIRRALAGDAPDDVDGLAVIPGDGLRQQRGGIVSLGDVGRDVVESLRVGIAGGGLWREVGGWARLSDNKFGSPDFLDLSCRESCTAASYRAYLDLCKRFL